MLHVLTSVSTSVTIFLKNNRNSPERMEKALLNITMKESTTKLSRIFRCSMKTTFPIRPPPLCCASFGFASSQTTTARMQKQSLGVIDVHGKAFRPCITAKHFSDGLCVPSKFYSLSKHMQQYEGAIPLQGRSWT